MPISGPSLHRSCAYHLRCWVHMCNCPEAYRKKKHVLCGHLPLQLSQPLHLVFCNELWAFRWRWDINILLRNDHSDIFHVPHRDLHVDHHLLGIGASLMMATWCTIWVYALCGGYVHTASYLISEGHFSFIMFAVRFNVSTELFLLISVSIN